MNNYIFLPATVISYSFPPIHTQSMHKQNTPISMYTVISSSCSSLPV